MLNIELLRPTDGPLWLSWFGAFVDFFLVGPVRVSLFADKIETSLEFKLETDIV
jgi:hypothetical protein